MRYLISLLISNLLIFQPAFATLNNVDKTQIFSKNLLPNGGFENGKAQWTPNDTADFTTSTTTPLEGGVNAEWDADASTDTLVTTAIAIPSGWYGRNGVASCLFVTPSGTATHEIQAYDGSNVLSEATITSSTSPTRTSTNFIFPSSGNIQLQIYANADEPNLEIDSCFLGPAEGYNVSSVSQATFVGGMENAGASSCSYTQNTSSGAGDFIDLGTGASCAAWTVVSNGPGTISAQGTGDHRLVYTNMPPGSYQITISGVIGNMSAATASTYFRLSDGTTTYQPQGSGGSANALTSNLLSYHVTVTTAATRTYKLQGADNAAITTGIWNGANSPMSWKIYRFPASSEQAYTPDTTNWRVDANLSGANFGLGSSNQTSYIGMTNSGITLTNNATATTTAQVPCATTTAPSGTTCTAADESNGVAFTIPRAGTYLACVAFGHQAAGSGSPVIATTFQIVETPTNAQTISQEGKSRINSGIGTASNMFFPHNLCGTFKFDSVGQKVLRLMYEQAITATVATNDVLGDASASGGQRDIHWTVVPLDQSIPAPVLTNMVTTGSSGGVKIEAANINCDAGSAITSQLGSWVSSVGNVSGGACAVTLTTGYYSATPYCWASPNAAFASVGLILSTAQSSATAVSVDCEDDASGACTSYDFNLFCIGAR